MGICLKSKRLLEKDSMGRYRCFLGLLELSRMKLFMNKKWFTETELCKLKQREIFRFPNFRKGIGYRNLQKPSIAQND